jgi:hypothetical protein
VKEETMKRKAVTVSAFVVAIPILVLAILGSMPATGRAIPADAGLFESPPMSVAWFKGTPNYIESGDESWTVILDWWADNGDGSEVWKPVRVDPLETICGKNGEPGGSWFYCIDYDPPGGDLEYELYNATTAEVMTSTEVYVPPYEHVRLADDLVVEQYEPGGPLHIFWTITENPSKGQTSLYLRSWRQDTPDRRVCGGIPFDVEEPCSCWFEQTGDDLVGNYHCTAPWWAFNPPGEDACPVDLWEEDAKLGWLSDFMKGWTIAPCSGYRLYMPIVLNGSD